VPGAAAADGREDQAFAPIFVVGMPRSGTSLMSRLLSSHPDIAIAPETHFVHDLFARHRRRSLEDDRGFAEVWRDYVGGHRFPDLGLDGAGIARRFVDGECGERSWQGLFRCLLNEYAAVHGKPRCGEKTPDHHRCLQLLLDWYPQARVVFVWRDPRAVAASLLAAPFGAPYAWFHALRWRRAYRSFQRWHDDPRMRAVHYEDLVTDPAATLAELLSFLGVTPMPEAWTPPATPPATRRGGWYREHLRQAGSAVVSVHREKWRTELSAREQATVECLAGRPMRRLGYLPALGAARWLAAPRLLLAMPPQQLLLRLRDLAYRDERYGPGGAPRAGDAGLRVLIAGGRWLSARYQALDRVLPGGRRGRARLRRGPGAVALEVAGDHPEDPFRPILTEDDELIGMLARRLLDAGQPVCLLAADQAGRIRARRIARAFHLRGRVCQRTDPRLAGHYLAAVVQTLEGCARQAGVPTVALRAASRSSGDRAYPQVQARERPTRRSTKRAGLPSRRRRSSSHSAALSPRR